MEIWLNITVAVLLILCILFCLRLISKISSFNTTKVELADFLAKFNQSIEKAEKSIEEIKSLSSVVDEALKSEIKKARFLANDLSYLSEKGDNIASKLENKINLSRDMQNRVSSVSAPMQESSLVRKSNISRAKNSMQIESENDDVREFSINQQELSGSKISNNLSISKKQALDKLLKEIAQKRAQL